MVGPDPQEFPPVPELSEERVFAVAAEQLGRLINQTSYAVSTDFTRAEQTAIFKKFTRGAAARALHVRGTGIGLAMARLIIHDHGGEIALDSEPGKGSTFTVFLPAVKPS